MSVSPSAPPEPQNDTPPPDPTSARDAWKDAVLRAPIDGRTWRAYLYLLVSAPLAFASFVALAVVLAVGVVTSWLVVGLVLVALTVLAARELGAVPRALVQQLLGRRVEAPRRRRRQRRGPLSWLGASLVDVDGWRAIAYVIVSFPVKVVGAYWVGVSLAMSVILAAYPVWWSAFGPRNTDADGVVRDSGIQLGEFYFDTWPRALLASAVGVVGVFVVPWLARTLTAVDGLLVHGLLGPTKLSERVDDLEVTRARAVDDSAATLRRIERDLHDGTQARLVALAMHLDMAKESLGEATDGPADPEAVARARALLDDAHSNATDAIAELREVTRSIHPPALDRGLDEALATLAARSGVAAQVRTELDVRPSPAIETIAYFCVAELLTNVAKHSGSRSATVDVRDIDGRLRVDVRDDGRGDARIVPGGGLAGLAERVRTVDGTVAVSSPPGGPTVVTVDLPLEV